jgi:hypothetical protein
MDTTKSSASAHTTTDPATRAGDPFAYAGDKPHGCALCMSSGFVFFGVLDEDLAEEVIEAVPCRRCTSSSSNDDVESL